MAEKLLAREKGFSEWYVDLVLKAKLADYSDVKGCMVIRPNGYALWENMQRVLDKMFKDLGHKNAYFPLLIPESYLKKEAEHVEGFNPQLAVVTHAGGAKLEEPLIIRPTSETIINRSFAKWIQSYRDLPLLINQWANVMRWEMRTRLFLRTTEFLWQEGHTCHETEEDAEKETLQMLEVYRTFAEDYMAMPVLTGRKSETEKFAGALRTYSIEAMMQDKKALQAGTSHNLGQNFAKAFETQFQGRDGKQHHVWQTSWGVSTRLIGGLIMTHSDDAGLIVPPRLAATHVVVIPILGKASDAEKAQVLEKAQAVTADLRKNGLNVVLDDDDTKSPGFKYNEHELIGTCLRLELGPKDLAKDSCVMVRRDLKQKEFVPLGQAVEKAKAMLDQMQADLFNKAKSFRDQHTFEVNSYEEMQKRAEDGFMLAHWCEKPACETKAKNDMAATTRCRPFDLKQEPGKCVVCGDPSPGRIVFSKAY
ncbi:proline--tRNA ligase [Hyalangium minutum]|uniref:Proline--tRNA ligase n=1 Tax=Hyalangium minutum TaxID=394096 RepID=A0A085VZ53_9BACT|nr:proline--tRNA ligase [Hyalangium minutum]KFE60716.1 Prolyl-tRNA synthetase [Hyalangium minutum]